MNSQFAELGAGRKGRPPSHRSTTLLLHPSAHSSDIDSYSPGSQKNMKVIITGEIGGVALSSSGFNCSIIPKTTAIANAGASGVLGSAVRRVFESSQADVLPLSFSRTGDGLVQLDLTNRSDVRSRFTEFKPDCEYRVLLMSSQPRVLI